MFGLLPYDVQSVFVPPIAEKHVVSPLSPSLSTRWGRGSWVTREAAVGARWISSHNQSVHFPVEFW